MPFTLSHPILVLPLHRFTRARLPLAGLVIGSMIPDVAYFVALKPIGTLGHTLPGIFLQGLPCGLALYLVWMALLRAPLVRILPRFVESRLVERRGTWTCRHWSLVCLALVLGAATHVAWDGFTHDGGWAVSSMPWMRAEFRSLPLYKWHQYAGGILGAAGIVTWGVAEMIRRPAAPSAQPMVAPWRKLLVWGWVAMCATTVATLSALQAAGGSFHVVLVRGVIGSLTGAFVGCMGYAAVWQARRWRRR